MASVTNPRTTFDHDENQRRVRHPLQLLRKYIRRYVALEGTALVLLFLAGWFWIGLALDYGSFKLFAFDWVQELRDLSPQPETASGIRLVLLLALTAVALSLILTKIILRYRREFNDANLALVLERRFPRELGDRLITAVEVADPSLAQRYGFSQQMVEQTVGEAVERLDRLPIAEAFNWARLRRLWLLVGLVTLGTFLVVGIAYCAGAAALDGNPSPVAFAWGFGDVSTRWGERNILLRDSYWPRRAYLEVLRFKPTAHDPHEMRMGQKHPGLQARAIRWVVADANAPDGWRPLRWADVPSFVSADVLGQFNIPKDAPYWYVDLDDLDPAVPSDVVPTSWQGKPTHEARAELRTNPVLSEKIERAKASSAVENLLDWQLWTVDKIEIQKEKARTAMRDQGHYSALENVFGQLQQFVDASGNNGRLRQLEVPDSVEVYYRGSKTKGRDSHQRQEGNKFAIGLNDLKESSRFRVRGADYYTPSKRITLVPPPAITELAVDKDEPAYLYHRLQGDDQTPLRGKVQHVRNYAVSTTGEMSTIEIPLGASLTLHARTDRTLRAPVAIKAPSKEDPKKLADSGHQATLDADGKGFTAAFGKVERPLDLTFEFSDDDNIPGQRRIVLQPAVDQPPEVVEVDLDQVLRKPRYKADPTRASQGTPADAFLITPDASLPFRGTLTDDHGLARAGWLHEVRQVDIELIGGAGGKDRLPVLILHGNTAQRRGALVASALQFGPTNPLTPTFGPTYLVWLTKLLEFDLAQSAGQGEVFVLMDEFRRTQEAKSLNDLPLTALEAKLTAKKSPPRLVPWSHQLKNETGKYSNGKEWVGFDLARHLPKLKVLDPSKEGQQHYLMRLSVVAIDNNIESGAPQRDETGQPFPGSASRSKSFFFLIVSENELLAQMALEEEVLFERLEKAQDKVKAGLTTTEEQIRKLSSGEATDLSLVSIRMNDVRGKAVLDAATITREVTADYNRILKEMEVNRVTASRVAKVRDNICAPLDEIVSPTDGSFAKAEDAVQKACQALEDAVAANNPGDKSLHLQHLRDTKRQLEVVRDQMERVLRDMNEGIAESKLLEILIATERTQRVNTNTLREIWNRRSAELIDSILQDPPKR